jgi:hypothetical protein
MNYVIHYDLNTNEIKRVVNCYKQIKKQNVNTL